MCGTAAAASSRSTVMRTSSEPARASAATCFAVASASAVSVLVIDCTTTGAPPPTVTLPTLTATVRCLSAGPENSIIGLSFVEFFRPGKSGRERTDITLPGPVYEHQAEGDYRDRHGKRRGYRLVEDQAPRCDAEQRGQKGKCRQSGCRVAHDEREPDHVGDAHHPDRLVGEGAKRERRGHRLDALAEGHGSDRENRNRDHKLVEHGLLGAHAVERACLDD